MTAERKRQALGRGLGALIPGGEAAAEQGQVLSVPVDEIFPNPNQPRRDFGTEALADLAASIREKGVLQPVLVHRVPGGYELVAGERRLRAARMAGLDRVPVLMRRIPAEEMLEIALIENIQREDLNPMEEAQAYRDLQERYGYTQEEVARRVGKDRATVANALRLLSLPDFVKKELTGGAISSGHGRALLGLKDLAAIRGLLTRIIKQGLSVREAEAAVSRSVSGQKVKKPGREASVELRDLEKRLERALGSRVRIHHGRGKGRMEISYSSTDELNGIAERILRKS